jgi:hypothetical protein
MFESNASFEKRVFNEYFIYLCHNKKLQIRCEVLKIIKKYHLIISAKMINQYN